MNRPMIEVRDLEAALRSWRPKFLEGEKRASVALIFHQDREGLELFFIHRSENPRDPWSGHMGFPGGRVDPEDVSPLSAVHREVREEIGFDLQLSGRLLGRLSDQRAVARGRAVGLVIEVRVFSVPVKAPMQANAEVQDMVWIPLSFFLEPGNRDEMEYRHSGIDLLLPCYHWASKRIWGLSLRMLDELLVCIGDFLGRRS